MSKRIWLFKMSFTWTAVALLNIMFKIWRVVKRMFQNLTLSKNCDSKNDELVDLTKILTYFDFLDSKSDALLKTFFEIWFFSKVLIGNWFFFHSFHQLVVFEKTHSCKIWRFHGLKRSKNCFSESKTFDKICFCTHQKFHF